MAFGQVDLQSNQWLSGHTGDRPVIDAIIAGFVTAPRCYQVFIMKKGLLYLDLGPEKKAGGQLSPGAAVAAGVLGGAVGGLIAGMVAQSMAGPEERGPRYDMQDDDTLLEMARGSKHSFVSLYNEIDSVSIDAPGFLSELFGNGKTAAWIKVRDRANGRVCMEIRGVSAVAAAAESLPRRLGDRVKVNVELDRRTLRYRSRR
jgi:hypothetical protein